MKKAGESDTVTACKDKENVLLDET